MTRKYKLLKELPGYPAGTVLYMDDGQVFMDSELEDPTDDYLDNLMNKWLTNPDWFEPVSDSSTRWRAEKDKTFWIIDGFGTVWERLEQENKYDDKMYKSGNYFRTREQAEAVAAAIKSVLVYIHSVNTRVGSEIEIDWQGAIHAAREAVRKERA